MESINYEFECTNCSPTWYTEQPNYLDMAYPGNEEALQQYDDVLFAYCTHCMCVTEFSPINQEPVSFEEALWARTKI